jgi:uncharacterized protein (TIGR03790 family)
MKPTIRYATLLIFLSCVDLSGNPPRAYADLQPDQVVILVNAKSQESLAVAAHYALRRGIPASHIVRLELPVRDSLTRQEYDDLIVAPLRQALRTTPLASTARVIVTTYGVPIRVDAPRLLPEENALLADAQSRVHTSRAALEQVRQALNRLGPGPPQPENPNSVPAQHILERARTAALLSRLDQAWRGAVESVQTRPQSDQEPEAQTLMRLAHQYGGWGILLQKTESGGRLGRASDTPAMTAWRALLEQTNPLWSGFGRSPITTQRQLIYHWVERLFGLRGVLEFASNEVDLLTYTYADASLDSELSLLWWDRDLYPVAWRWENSLFQDLAQNQDALPVLMVSRLDAPTSDLAKGLVDKALQAEQSGLRGSVYFDARGLNAKDASDTYGVYDQSLRDAAQLVRERSDYRVVLDNNEATLSRPGTAPDVALYIGWYKLRAYEDAFTFNPGAIGYHMASAEAITVHDRRERGWCKNALERGITATLGSVGEPYLDAFPEPDRFTALLLTGKYSLVEAYYLTSRYVSWRMVLFGDPLYNPMRGRSLQTANSAVPLSVPPSERPLGDPPARLAQKHREQKEQMAMLTKLLLDAEAGSVKPSR